MFDSLVRCISRYVVGLWYARELLGSRNLSIYGKFSKNHRWSCAVTMEESVCNGIPDRWRRRGDINRVDFIYYRVFLVVQVEILHIERCYVKLRICFRIGRQVNLATCFHQVMRFCYFGVINLNALIHRFSNACI